MKTISFILLATLIFIGFSCKKEDSLPQKPVVSISELGYNNSGEAYLGSDLHIEGDIEAEGVIRSVAIEIHPEFSGNWEFDTSYAKFIGLKNSNFHEHIDIPATADTGDYHFHLKVIDNEGQTTEWEGELHIGINIDLELPQIQINQAPVSGQSFATGDTITISGRVTDNISLGGLYIGLVRNNLNLTDAEVGATNTITMLHNHAFAHPLQYDFSAQIIVGAAADNNNPPKDLTTGGWWQSADYYLLVKCKDASGNWAFSQHYPIVLQ